VVNEARVTSRRRWAGPFLAALVLLAGTAVSFAAHAVAQDGEDRYAQQLMDRYASEIVEAIGDRIAVYGATLTDLAYAVGAQPDLSSDTFARISAGFDDVRLPSITSVGYVVPATTAEVAGVQRLWRTRGVPGLTLVPTAGPEHEFVIFQKAFDGRRQTAGADLGAGQTDATVLRTAQQSKVLAISPAYPADGATAGAAVTMAAPVFSGLGSTAPDQFSGWVVMTLRGQDLLSATLIGRGHGAVQTDVTDPAAGGAVLADATPDARLEGSVLVRIDYVTVGQRSWQVTMWPTSRLLASADRGLSLLTLVSGVAMSVLLAALLGILASSRNRALDQVERATAALRDDIDRRAAVEAQLREREDQLRRLAFRDPLTGLANRMLFYDRLGHALHTHARQKKMIAVLFIDLDGFKLINDQLGHHAGDVVLQAVAERLRTGLRAGDTVARFGGDEFAIILESLATEEDARIAATRVIAEVQQPIDVDGVPAGVSASVGIAVNSDENAGPDDMIRLADAAMYSAKKAGKNRYAEAGVTST
jgi:diguanylate cyclase (GGDEF)-like protein